MPDREMILSQIRRLAVETGAPPGRGSFEKETGIRRSEWHGVYWRSWGDALEECGFTPNKKQEKFSSDDVLRKYAEAVRHFGRIPANIDLRMYSRDNADFPGHTTFANHFKSNDGLIEAFSGWLESNSEFEDLLLFIPRSKTKEPDTSNATKEGLVYLLQSGSHYKIGRSDEIERRVKQITIALPESVTLIHTITTDDPPGIEAYWHRRFAEKRANGEWFRLTVADVKAFKKRKFQ